MHLIHVNNNKIHLQAIRSYTYTHSSRSAQPQRSFRIWIKKRCLIFSFLNFWINASFYDTHNNSAKLSPMTVCSQSFFQRQLNRCSPGEFPFCLHRDRIIIALLYKFIIMIFPLEPSRWFSSGVKDSWSHTSLYFFWRLGNI